MSKKIFKIGSLVFVFALGLFVLTGCGKIETEKLTQQEYGYKLSVEVPKDKGYHFIEKLEEPNEFAMNYPSFILDGDKVQLFFENPSFVYHTSLILKEKYPDMDTENPNFDDFIKYSEFSKDSIIEINGKKAVKRKYEYGPADNFVLKGYTFDIERDDESRNFFRVMVLPKKDDADVKALMEDPEVKVIIDSLKFTSTK